MGTKDRRLSCTLKLCGAAETGSHGPGSVYEPAAVLYGGGTAIAIQLGHRRSLDFDWFTGEQIDDPMQLAASFRDEGFNLSPVKSSEAPCTGRFRVSGLVFSNTAILA